MLSGWATLGAGVMACADTATDKANPAIVINLIIPYLLGIARRSTCPAGGRSGDPPQADRAPAR
jgi:hypothetical protein